MNEESQYIIINPDIKGRTFTFDPDTGKITNQIEIENEFDNLIKDAESIFNAPDTTLEN